MMPTSITNTASVGKSYEADNGKRIHFEPGEEKEVESLPPSVDADTMEAPGWKIEEENGPKPETEDENGGEN